MTACLCNDVLNTVRLTSAWTNPICLTFMQFTKYSCYAPYKIPVTTVIKNVFTFTESLHEAMRFRLPQRCQAMFARVQLKLTSLFGAPINSENVESALCHPQQKTYRLKTAFSIYCHAGHWNSLS